jgi:hypothetical protein
VQLQELTRFFFDEKEIETDLSLALRMDPCILIEPIFLLIKIFVLVFQLDKCGWQFFDLE